MIRRAVTALGGWGLVLLGVIVFLGIGTLVGFGYRATRGWQQSSELLKERDTSEAIDLLLKALTRDMAGMQSRVLASGELQDAGSDIVKHCIYWCAKESLVKIHGKKDLIFAENLKIDSFTKQKEGELIGRIIVKTYETAIPLQYFVYDNFVVVVSK